MKGYIFVSFYIKMINNADSFSQPSLIIFTKGANIYIYNIYILYIYIIVKEDQCVSK